MQTLAVLVYGVCVVAIILGGATALGASNALKRILGLVIAHVGAALLLSLLGSASLALALLAALAAELALGAALCTRLIEDCGSTECDVLAEVDSADEERA